MQKNKNLIFITFFLFFSFDVSSFDKKGLYCLEGKSEYDIIFYFNHKKVFYLDVHYDRGTKTINDQFAYFKDYKEVGEDFIIKKQFMFWGRNSWRKAYNYKLNLNNLILTQKFILKKKLLSKLEAKLFNKSKYYVEVRTYKCKILKSWNEIEILFKNKK